MERNRLQVYKTTKNSTGRKMNGLEYSLPSMFPQKAIQRIHITLHHNLILKNNQLPHKYRTSNVLLL